MLTDKEKRAAVQRSLLIRREKLIKQGLCRDCGLNAIEKPDPNKPRKKKPTLCADCKKDRSDREARRRLMADLGKGN